MQKLMLVISGGLSALTKYEIKYRDKQISQAEQTTVATYESMAMPADLRGDHILNLATNFWQWIALCLCCPEMRSG